MYIKKVSLENIRGFEKLELDLTRPDGSFAGWTVFTGGNGAGKSTLLKAFILGTVNQSTAHSLQPGLRNLLRTNPKGGKGVIKVWENLAGDQYIVEKRLEMLPNGFNHSIDNVATNNSTATVSSVKRFACGYGPFRRVFGASTDTNALMTAQDTSPFVTMFHEAASLFEVDQWLRQLNYKALEGNAEAKDQLAIVLEILRDDLLPNQITVDRVNSDGLWLQDRNGTQLNWHDMSDGYRSTMALLADILRHMIGTFDMSDLLAHDREGKLVMKPAGVVFIDEVDAHLHPEWQREIGFWLKKHFPNIQFLVTSHSPLICQAADPNGLFVLPEPGSNEAARALTMDEYNEVISSRADTILRTPAFGLENTRSPRAVSARADYARLQAKKRAGATLTAEEQQQEQALKVFAENREEA